MFFSPSSNNGFFIVNIIIIIITLFCDRETGGTPLPRPTRAPGLPLPPLRLEALRVRCYGPPLQLLLTRPLTNGRTNAGVHRQKCALPHPEANSCRPRHLGGANSYSRGHYPLLGHACVLEKNSKGNPDSESQRQKPLNSSSSDIAM